MAQKAVHVLHSAHRLLAGYCGWRLGQRIDPDDPLHVRPRTPESPARRPLPVRFLRLRAVGADHRYYECFRAEQLECRAQDLHDHVLPAGNNKELMVNEGVYYI